MRVQVLSERPMGKKVIRYLKSIGETIVEKNPDILIVAYYPRILKKEEFEDIPYGAINFHPGYLPYNRGMYPHVWPLIDGSPAGVTLHYINEKVDTGDIIAQKRIKVSPTDIASDLEEKTQHEIFELFKKMWMKIKDNRNPWRPQVGKGSYHPAKEITSIQKFDKKTIDRLRACTFRDRSYAYFIDHGKKVYVGVKFFKKSDIDRFNKKNHEY